MIDVKGISFGYGRETALHDVSFSVRNGEVTGLIGPNGAGKTTLLRLMAGLMKPREGQIVVDGRGVGEYSSKALARQLSFLPQSRPLPDISVRSLVELGRFSHEKGGSDPVEEAIRAVGIEDLANRDLRSLSGGQRQMAYLAMLLSQGAPNVLLDEPLAHLDIGAQLDVCAIIRRMKENGKCVVVVSHDLHMLEALCDRVILLDRGKTTFDGFPSRCLLSGELEAAFQVRALPGQGTGFQKTTCFT